MQCLRLLTQDKREFFLPKNTYLSITEFAKKFQAEISLVDAEKPPILTTKELVKQLCNNEYKNSNVKFKLIKMKIGKKDKIKDYIIANLINGKDINIKSILEQFKDYNKSTITNYFYETKRELVKKGYKIKKINNKYKII